jgi:hypothetical protein
MLDSCLISSPAVSYIKHGMTNQIRVFVHVTLMMETDEKLPCAFVMEGSGTFPETFQNLPDVTRMLIWGIEMLTKS